MPRSRPLRPEDAIPDDRYRRRIRHGLRKLRTKRSPSPYSSDEILRLEEARVDTRLAPRATAYYLELASRSPFVANLIKARPEEMNDLSGERDPSNQLRYSPVPGVLHKYELILLYVVRTCSSWCRYCYRSDFLTGKTEKEIAAPKETVAYIRRHNAAVRERGEGVPIREALLSGGDPMVLSNRKLFVWLDRLAGAGLRTIRIGTKELAFFPFRFDRPFFDMIDVFHARHPEVNLPFMVHFTHPHEILEIDDEGRLIEGPQGPRRIAAVESAIRELVSRPYISLQNQTPIINGVNDDPDSLRTLHRQLWRLGIRNYYYFQCREIEGHRLFALPVEEAWRIHAESQRGLSGIERSRFVLSTEAGKLELVSVVDARDADRAIARLPDEARPLAGAILGDGFVVFKLHRSADPEREGDLIVARRNPEALWITGYEDRILYDGRLGRSRFAPFARDLLAASAALPHGLGVPTLAEQD